MKLIVYKQYLTLRAKIEPTPLGSISYKGEKSRANPRVDSYGQFQKYAKEKADPRVDPGPCWTIPTPASLEFFLQFWS